MFILNLNFNEGKFFFMEFNWLKLFYSISLSIFVKLKILVGLPVVNLIWELNEEIEISTGKDMVIKVGTLLQEKIALCEKLGSVKKDIEKRQEPSSEKDNFMVETKELTYTFCGRAMIDIVFQCVVLRYEKAGTFEMKSQFKKEILNVVRIEK